MCPQKVHSAIGPGVLESVYQTCLLHELQRAGMTVQAQVSLPVLYDGLHLDSGYRIDLLVENTVIVELKCGRNRCFQFTKLSCSPTASGEQAPGFASQFQRGSFARRNQTRSE